MKKSNKKIKVLSDKDYENYVQSLVGAECVSVADASVENKE